MVIRQQTSSAPGPSCERCITTGRQQVDCAPPDSVQSALQDALLCQAQARRQARLCAEVSLLQQLYVILRCACTCTQRVRLITSMTQAATGEYKGASADAHGRSQGCVQQHISSTTGRVCCFRSAQSSFGHRGPPA